jgi:dTMP kinase
MSKGIFIVIDGSDGSGKSTQYAKLCDRLKAENIAFETIKFPRHKQPPAYFVDHYLQGRYGQADEVPAKRASVFYAMDRYDAAQHIREQLNRGVAVIADRYVGANMGHQGAKMPDAETRQEFFSWLNDFEFNLMGIPRPDVNIVLSVSDEQAARNIAKRAAETDHPSDIHEANPDFLRRSTETYHEICDLFPDQYHCVDCMQNTESMLPADTIHDQIWELVSTKLKKGNET